MHDGFVLARIRLTRTAAERGPVLFGECDQVVRCYITLVYWLAFALRGRPLSTALSSSASAARWGCSAERGVEVPSVFEPPQ